MEEYEKKFLTFLTKGVVNIYLHKKTAVDICGPARSYYYALTCEGNCANCEYGDGSPIDKLNRTCKIHVWNEDAYVFPQDNFIRNFFAKFPLVFHILGHKMVVRD